MRESLERFVQHQSPLRTEQPSSVMENQQAVPQVNRDKNEDELEYHVRVMFLAVEKFNLLAQKPLGEILSMTTNDEELGYVLCLWTESRR